MSRDIRSYFLPSRGEKKKDEKNKDSKQNSGTKPRKRQLVILDSDSDEDILPTKVKKVEEKKSIGLSTLSDEKDKHSRSDTEKRGVKEASKLKPVNVADVFGTSQVRRTVTKPKEKDEISSDVKLVLEDQHSDSDFEATLRQLDEQQLGFKKEKKRTVVNEKEKIPVKEKPKLKVESTETNKNTDEHSKVSPTRNNKVIQKGEVVFLHDKTESKEKESGHYSHSKKTSSDLFKKDEERKSGGITHENEHSHEKNNKAASPALDRTSLNDSLSDDPFEKKKQHAIQYQKYLQREGPKNPGGKEIPVGKPGCLSGLVFVITGVLETIDREQANSLIRQYGGRVTSSISRNTSYIIVGDEPGPSKMEKAMKLNTKQLTEDGFLDLIRTSPGLADGSKVPINSSKKKNMKKDDNDFRSSKPLSNDNEHKQSVEVSKSIKKEETATTEIKKDVQTNSLPHSPSAPKESSVVTVGSSPQQHLKTSSLWADKYKPSSVKQIIGQQGDRSNVKKLLRWLQNWHSNHSGKKKLVRPSPWAKDDNGAFFKAALLSGSPGVGKTTSAHLVCKELGFDVVEFNASDTRSKKLLHEEVTELLSSKSLSGYFQGATGSKPTENHVLVMDEVDGMAGNEDRGGVQELIQLIKSSRVPIICMCNDRHHQKIRSLTNYCFDLPFSKPRLEQIRGAMMSICFKEGIKISPEALNDIITGANHDVRQVLHHLSMWSVKDKQLSLEQAKDESQKAKKNIKLGPWDVLKKVFSADAHKTMSIHDKSDLFFHDYSLGPLFVQENYLGVMPHKARGNKNKHLELVAKTADSLSSGDLVEKSIRSRNAWSLLPMQAMFSSVLPGDIMEGHLTSQINFPAWLGKNSRRNKFQRLVQELHMHMRLSISGSREAVNLDYLMHIRDSIVSPLIKEGAEGIPATLAVMQNYYLMREDIDSILELSLWPHQKDPMSMVESKVKAALTRTYNKGGILTPYSIINVKKGAAKTNPDMDMEIEGEDAVDEEEVEEDVTTDAMIKAKKRPAPTKDSASGSNSVKRGKYDGKSKKDGKALKRDGKGKTKM